MPFALTSSRVSGYFPALVDVGGVEVPCDHLREALQHLRNSPGLMIKQPLVAIGSPLASCNYHAVAAPYRARFLSLAAAGRGAAGRPLAKQAFCAALEDLIARTSAAARLAELHADALAAFASDSAYAAAMAATAVDLAAKAHRARLLTTLRQSSHQAISACDARRGQFTCSVAGPCGTGACRWAAGILTEVEADSSGGKLRRPANHTGGSFDITDALPDLERLQPFVVAIPVSDGDTMRGESAEQPCQARFS